MRHRHRHRFDKVCELYAGQQTAAAWRQQPVVVPPCWKICANFWSSISIAKQFIFRGATKQDQLWFHSYWTAFLGPFRPLSVSLLFRTSGKECHCEYINQAGSTQGPWELTQSLANIPVCYWRCLVVSELVLWNVTWQSHSSLGDSTLTSP